MRGAARPKLAPSLRVPPSLSSYATRIIPEIPPRFPPRRILHHLAASGLCPKNVIERMAAGGFDGSKCETMEMITGLTKLIVAHKA